MITRLLSLSTAAKLMSAMNEAEEELEMDMKSLKRI